MDPVSVGMLAALAGGAGGELGRQAWAALSDVVRRPFGRRPGASSGEAELRALDEAPDEPARAEALRGVLVARAAEEPEFAAALASWHQQVRALPDGSVTNTVSGGTQYGAVVQGRDFHGVSFGAPPPPPVPEG
ncbi:hypothetical protein [Streptomyces termitum]|uniref:hypothetical protein n=1 Tax=Streptomyces termitum TaxID=67368 RepID=UPI0033A9B822